MRSSRLLLCFAVSAGLAAAQLVPEVRATVARNDLAAGEKLIAEYRGQRGVTPEMLEALSWLGRGALAVKSLDEAEQYASETRKLALDELKKRPLDAERRLPLALGAAIEVHGHVLAERGARTEAVAFLQGELKRWWNTSIRTRIQKNIHLLSLEGKPAPDLELSDWLGAERISKSEWKGRPVLLFFWAHWCGDCKNQASALQRIREKHRDSDLILLAPTQRYGFTARGQEAGPEQETEYIRQVREQYYGVLEGIAVPISEENFRRYGASTTPTLVLVDRRGQVNLYHPGGLSYDQLEARVSSVLRK
jgi:thiol-disulfide isomerase/thioredoxin